ncbi:LysE family transporter [Bradyrhizobium sp. CB82]|uniref:LysE family translocator n=1 Tax=Bradyrhizobium sp. CB82 TaxID=3039159 RepID=UPI0024B19B5A|nr:LysE family transporter [Bradyrhizobium sp. CB82]WFU42034.1 LysE family transporter [Bradyrhizobium sp. CB82]
MTMYLGTLASIALMQLLGAASPGPNFFIVTSYSLAGSLRRGLLAVAGILAGSLCWALLAAAGLGVLVTAMPSLYAALRIAGAAYLIWVGVKMLFGTSRSRSGASKLETIDTDWQVVRAGFLTNMANPKSIAYYSSIFVAVFPADPPTWLFWAAVSTAVTVSAVWWISVAALFSLVPVRRAYERFKAKINTILGIALICLGLRMAIFR